MGSDGARGLKTMREAGAITIAQDKKTAAVYGMPAAAIECGAALIVQPLSAIMLHALEALQETDNAGMECC